MTAPQTMLAAVLEKPGEALLIAEVPVPSPGSGQVLIKVHACGVCRTDLHIADGELTKPKLPLIPGHEIVGVVAAKGRGAARFHRGDRVGVPWLGSTCGKCRFCKSGRENLCDSPSFTGYTADGGFAQYAVADQRFCFPIPHDFSDTAAAPLLCAGLIGYRSYRMCGDTFERLGIYGFGAAAHIVAQIAVYEKKKVYAFVRPGDTAAQEFARGLGAVWAGDSTARPPQLLDAAIIFAPAGELVPAALEATVKGGTVVCGGIHMSDIPSFPYRLLWEERVVRSVANLTREEGGELMALAAKVPVKTHVGMFPLEKANEALAALREGTVNGAAVLVMK
jgi:propanol-preferring alcohol dehydrogenase